MNPNDATAADPQVRALLEVSFEALQNCESQFPVHMVIGKDVSSLTYTLAGIKLEEMAGTNAGVYVASFVKGS